MPRPSDPLKASSDISTPRLAPIAISRRRTSSSSSPPTVATVTVPPNSGCDLQRLFHRIVIRFVDRIDQLIALNIVSGAVELNLIFRSVWNSSHAN